MGSGKAVRGIDWSAPRRAVCPRPRADPGPGGGGVPPGGAGERSVFMNQLYWNEPSKGYAMSAEEFAAGACCRPDPKPCPPPKPGCGCGQSPVPPGCSCGCGGSGSDCPGDNCGQTGSCTCCQQMICCCRPAPAPAPQPPQVEEGCCCKQSFRAALGLLCDEQISNLLDFDAAAFITDTYTAGAALTCGKPSAGDTSGDDTGGAAAQAEDDDGGDDAGTTGKPTPTPPCCPSGVSDNLGTLSGSFRRFSPCSCDLLDIDAELYTAGAKGCAFTASQVNLCELDAVVIQAAAACPEGDLTADEATARNFRCLRQLLAQRLNPCGDPCGQTYCSCACDGRDCCCAAGLLSTLAQNNLSRRVSLAAGLLVLSGVTLLGTVGNVLVLANECDNRLYFVCVNSVQFIG